MDNKKVGVGFGVLIQRDEKILLGRRHDDPDKADSVFRAGLLPPPNDDIFANVFAANNSGNIF